MLAFGGYSIRMDAGQVDVILTSSPSGQGLNEIDELSARQGLRGGRAGSEDGSATPLRYQHLVCPVVSQRAGSNKETLGCGHQAMGKFSQAGCPVEL